MHTFRILHASDLHVAETPWQVHIREQQRPGVVGRRFLFQLTSHDPDCLEVLARRVQGGFAEGSIDLVVLSGDLATSGSREDLDAALAVVKNGAVDGWVGRDGMPTLNGDLHKLTLMPGNHDRFCHGITCLPGGTAFDEVFAAYWHCGQGVQELAHLKDAASGESLVVIAADLTLTGIHDARPPTSYFGQGRVRPEVLTELRDRCGSVRFKYPGCAIALFVHFSPEHPSKDPQLTLLEEALLVRLCQELDIAHVFCGHYHERAVYQGDDGQTTIYSAGSASQCAAAENGFHVRHVDVSAGRIVSVRSTDVFWNAVTRDWDESRA